jgi:hypothetical protein
MKGILPIGNSIIPHLRNGALATMNPSRTLVLILVSIAPFGCGSGSHSDSGDFTLSMAALADLSVTWVDETSRGVKLDIGNASQAHRVVELELEAVFVDCCGDPMPHDDSGDPLIDVRTVTFPALDPGQTQTLLVHEWADLDYLQSIGHPIPEESAFQVRIVAARGTVAHR